MEGADQPPGATGEPVGEAEARDSVTTQEAEAALVRGLLERSPAAPARRWCHDRQSGIPGGPLLAGRYFHGAHHEFYVGQVGEKVANEVRDSLVRAKLRVQLLRSAPIILLGDYALRPSIPLGLSFVFAFLLGGLLAAFLVIGSWRRRQADEATHLGRRWRLALVALSLAPVVAAIILERAGVGWVHLPQPGSDDMIAWGIGASFALALVTPLIAAIRSRRLGARISTAWRGNLRQTLPIMIAVCGSLALAFAGYGKALQIQYTREWFRTGPNEMALIKRELKEAWTDPVIPPDAWREQRVPELK